MPITADERSAVRRAAKWEPGFVVHEKYVLAEKLAVGGMGEVWRAKNKDTRADVAIKVVRGDLLDVASGATRLRQEARVSAALGHRHVIRVFDFVDGEAPMLVLEFLSGQTLRSYLKRKGRLSFEEALAFIRPILSALERAHALGFVHRDIKPANIFLAVDPDGRVIPKLLDFGIAQVPDPSLQTLTGTVLGTPRYMSPEQIRDQPLSGVSDLFSIASIMVELVTGTNPFAADSPTASMALVLEHTVDPPPEIPPKAWLVLARALSKHPIERPASAEEFSRELTESWGGAETTLEKLLTWDAPQARAAIGARNSLTEPNTAPEISINKSRPRGRWILGLAVISAVAIASAAATRWLSPTPTQLVLPTPSAQIPVPTASLETSPSVSSTPPATASVAASVHTAVKPKPTSTKPAPSVKPKEVGRTPDF